MPYFLDNFIFDKFLWQKLKSKHLSGDNILCLASIVGNLTLYNFIIRSNKEIAIRYYQQRSIQNNLHGDARYFY